MCLIFSCSTNEVTNDPLKNSISKFISSTHFSNLTIPVSSIDITSAQASTTQTGKKALIFSFRENKSLRKVIGLFDSNGDILSATIFEITTQINPSEISNKLQNHEFLGTLTWSNPELMFSFDVQGVKINNGKISSAREEIMPPPCRNIDQVMSCAGNKMANQGPFSKVLCYVDFVVCLAANIADCIYEGCTNSGPVNPA